MYSYSYLKDVICDGGSVGPSFGIKVVDLKVDRMIQAHVEESSEDSSFRFIFKHRRADMCSEQCDLNMMCSD